MEKENVKRTLPLNLQFFAEGTKDDDENQNDNSDGQNNDNDNNNDGDNSGKDSSKGKSTEKTFTQAQVNAMMAKEKNEGRKAILNALGYSSIDEIKKDLSGKSDEKKSDEVNKELETAKSEAEKRANDAENKLACVMAGVNKDSVEDVLAIALTKVSGEKTLTNVLEEMKNVSKYSSFFGETKKTGGTGSDVGHIGNNSKSESLAQRLAKQNSTNQNKKSSYFN